VEITICIGKFETIGFIDKNPEIIAKKWLIEINIRR
jgi:hypothetical protein